MNYPKAYLDYLVYFHGPRDFFECHEILEEFWKSRQGLEYIWVGLIQIAVALYHYRRGNRMGATKMMESAIRNLEENPVTTIGIDQEQLLSQMREIIKRCDLDLPYIDINLPIVDIKLLNQSRELCNTNGYVWGAQSNLTNSYLIHKHKLRDRTEVILERKIQLEKRKNS